MKGDSRRYWRKTLQLTISLLVIWSLVTFGLVWYARELNNLVFLGFPLGFYMAAQGALIVYLVIIGLYNLCMRKLDTEFELD